MSKKIEVNGSYFYITDTISGEVWKVPSKDLRLDEKGESFFFYDTLNIRENISIVFSDATDLNNLAWTNEQALVDFIESNTGFNTALGSSNADNFTGGFVDYNDLATATTPIPFTAVGHVVLTNDKAGANTNELYLPSGVTSLFSGNQFDFTELKKGDMLDIRLDVDVTTDSPNQVIIVNLALGVGAGEYEIPFENMFEKSAGAHKINRFNGIYMGDDNTLLNPAEFRLSSDGTGTVTVNGWYIKIIKKG